jgi:hypothetical protein
MLACAAVMKKAKGIPNKKVRCRGHHIPEDRILHSHRSENLKSYKKVRLSLGDITQFLRANCMNVML